jgi:dihydrodipicolinate synthase/N-acetylneuraminate lyase
LEEDVGMEGAFLAGGQSSHYWWATAAETDSAVGKVVAAVRRRAPVVSHVSARTGRKAAC